MRKIILTAVIALSATATISSQVENRALRFTKEGIVDCGGIPAINNLSSYSIQFWLCPDNWTEGAVILQRGEGFYIKLGTTGTITANVDGQDFVVKSENLKPGEWNQITIICDNGYAKALINGNPAGEGTLKSIPEDSENSFIIGGGYTGLIDEVRIWNDSLNEMMKKFEYFIFNTLNKWNPMWENLVVYYKMDQENCQYLIDYKGIEIPEKGYDNHGVLSGGVERVLAANDKMPYLVNAAYTENSRFFDRIIPRDQYLLSNEIIILGADCVAADGHVHPRTPNNHATLQGDAAMLASHEGRDGVLSLSGKGYLETPASTFRNEKTYMFETWLYLEEWTPGAYLLRKENDEKSHGLAIMLGADKDNPTLTVRIEGTIANSVVLPIKTKEWIHVGVNPTNQNNEKLYSFYINGQTYDCNAKTTEASVTAFTEVEDIPIRIGEGLNGKLDETCLWNRTWLVSDIKNHANSIPLPSLNKNVSVEVMGSVGAYYRYDRSDEPGFSYHSQDNWADIMRSAFDGHSAPKISISVRGHGVDNPNASDYFVAIMGNYNKRKVFAKDLAEMSKHYDGVELDLEWVYDASGWSTYSSLVDEIIKVLPDGKTLRISNHNVTYAYPVAKIKDEGITGFTLQQYGPQQTHFNLTTFKQKIQDLIKYGYPADKIMSSYSTTTSNGSNGSPIMGVRGGIYANYEGLTDDNIEKYVNNNGETFYFMGPMQVYNRAKYTREQKLQGIFYWDMGNDYWKGTAANPEMPEYHSARFCSYGINANIDTIVNQIEVRHIGNQSGITSVTQEKASGIKIYPSPAYTEINIALSSGETPVQAVVYSSSGSQQIVSHKSKTIDITNLSPGIYIVTAKEESGREYNSKFIKR